MLLWVLIAAMAGVGLFWVKVRRQRKASHATSR
jgi:hypothetical protein